MHGMMPRRSRGGGDGRPRDENTDSDTRALVTGMRPRSSQGREMDSGHKDKQFWQGARTPGRISRRALPVLHRSPSWPPMKFDFHEELKKVQKPRTIRKAVLFACFVIVNNIFIVVAATFLLRGYLQVETVTDFGPGLVVKGKLSADSMNVQVDQGQSAVFRSYSGDSAVGIHSATTKTAKLTLAKSSSIWGVSNNPKDQFVVSKGSQTMINVDGVTKTTVISTHIDAEANSIYGSPLVLTTRMPRTGSLVNVTAGDILLAPSKNGRVKVNAPFAPVSGDIVFEPERRVVVEKAIGPVASLLLHNTQLEIQNGAGHIHVLSTLNVSESTGVGVLGSLSLSSAIFIGGVGQNNTVSLAGPLKMNDNKIYGRPLALVAQNGSDLTLDAESGGSVVVSTPMTMSGPVTPQAASGILQVAGTLKVHNLQLELAASEMSRPDSSPQPSIVCTLAYSNRFGWIRMTRDYSAHDYHLFLCTENGWQEIKFK